MLDPRRKRLLHLLLYKSYAELRAENARLRMGALWWFVEPVMHMLVFYFVFAVILQRRTEDFVWFLLTGQIAWRWFQQAMMQGSNAIYQNRNLMQQVYIAKSFFPSVSLLSQSFKFVLTFAILMVLLWVFGFEPNAAYIMLPVVVAVNFLLVAGGVYLLAAVIPFVPDLRIIIENALRALMFMSGIFFSGRDLPEPMQTYFFMNPIAALLQAYRDILLDARYPEWSHLLLSATVALVGIAVGKSMLRRFDQLYPRVVQV